MPTQAAANKNKSLPNAAQYLKDRLWSWQWKYLRNTSRWIIVNKSRQIGFTEVALLKELLHCIKHDGHISFLISTRAESAKRQLLERIKKRWLPALMKTSSRPHIKGYEANKSEITLPNGSQLIAVSNEADRLRGETDASFLCDEAATWETRLLDDLESAIFPIIRSGTNQRSRITFISTPKPTQNLYREIWENKQLYPQFDRIEVDIRQACKDPNFPEDDPDKFRKECASDDEYMQEYLTTFLDTQGRYYNRADVLECEATNKKEILNNADNRPYMGIDLGGQNDYTAIVCGYKTMNDHIYVDKAWRLRSIKYRKQERIISSLIDSHSPQHVVIDETAHPALTEYVQDKCPGIDIEGNRATNIQNVELTQQLKDKIEDNDISFNFSNLHEYNLNTDSFIEANNYIAQDLTKVERSETTSGKLKFSVPRDKSGHGDSYSALLLLLKAIGEEPMEPWVF